MVFHEYFGFSRTGVNSKALSLPELDVVDDKEHWMLRKHRHAFLRAVHYGKCLPLDARLLLSMNPSQILGVMAGFNIIADSGALGKWKTDPVELYCDLYKRGFAVYRNQLSQVESVSVDKRVHPFSETDRSLFERLGEAVCRNPDISAKFQVSDSLKRLFDTRLQDVYDPGRGRPHATNRRRYAKNILACLNSIYAEFRNSDKFDYESVMARNAMIIP